MYITQSDSHTDISEEKREWCTNFSKDMRVRFMSLGGRLLGEERKRLTGEDEKP